MEKAEIIKNAEQELQWLKYYANAETRKTFIITKSPYDQFRSIGYTKRVIPLSSRCVFLRVTANEPITKDTKLEDLIASNDLRNPEKNIFSALEFIMIKYPEDHDWIIKSIQ